MKFISRLLIVLLAITGIFGFASSGEAASSLEKEMKEMLKRGIISGHTDGRIGEKDNVTREQFAAFISRALELPKGEHSFKDVPANSNLSSDVAKVYSSGIMEGVSADRFAPKANITRAQVVLTMQKVLAYSGMEMERNAIEFTDSKDMTSVVLSAIYNISSYKIVLGNLDGSFKPNANATREQAAAFIYRFLTAKEQVPDEKFDPNTYYIGTVENKKLVVPTDNNYPTHSAASTAFNADAKAVALLKGTDIVAIKDGVVYGDHTTIVDGKKVGDVTTIYSSADFKKQLTYMEPGREMRFIEATGQYVKVQAGGTIGYAKQGEVDFVPTELVKEQEFYQVMNGELYHYQYNFISGKQETPYPVGPAPIDMKTGVKYKSLDGVHFTPFAGGAEIKHYPYFQYQSVRSKTSYTAEELDRYIMTALNGVNNSSERYQNAVTRSKLIGHGKFILEMQEKYNVNGLFILAAAMHESQYGMSKIAQEKNNLFGIEVYDNGLKDGKVYNTPKESIEDFAKYRMDSDYADTWRGVHYNGAAPGNKTTGITVSYASDPAWGLKVAGHMYRADKALGKKDLNKYQLGITNAVGVKVFPTPAATTNYLYHFSRTNLGVNNAFGYPVIITDSKDGYYQIISELKEEDDDYNGIGWILKENVTKIN